MNHERIQELTSMITDWKKYEYLAQVPGATMLLYYYATTLDEEVRRIWPLPSRKLGKLLYIGARHATILRIILDFMVNMPCRFDLGVKTCMVVRLLAIGIHNLSITLIKAVFYLCLYALLGGSQKYLWALAAVFTVMVVPGHVLYWLASLMWTETPIGELDRELGYSCSPQEPTKNALYKRLNLATGIVSFVGASVVLVAGVITFAVRYRGQHNELTTTIQRQGAQYYLAALVISFLGVLRPLVAPTPDSPGSNTLILLNNFLAYLYPIFSDRLLLKLQKYDRTMSRQDVSELIFGPVPDDPVDDDLDTSEDTNEDGVEGAHARDAM
ncbi:hypothetical protein DFP72DRAFT_1166985 [Ephemerocybe angulata]|uniref:DUF6533 domain-containing protein n=1 Tax=Ephemerocybe angulata TaxID=980116 RepID=A0A8H6I8U2_9AGAR|nr:hypothetical protein DFP72DRAFT_1166985 [Tulosesus angulatus]